MFKVYVTRNVPDNAIAMLQKDCTITQWASDDHPVPQDELLKNVKGIDGLYCLLTDDINEEVIKAAGKFSIDEYDI